MESATGIQILYEAVCITYRANAIEKNLSLSLPGMGK